MLPTTTATHIYTGIGAISADVIQGALPYLYVVAGLFIAFWVIKKLTDLFMFDKRDKIYSKMVERGTAMKKEIDKLG